jgi:hypothetical protein
MIQTKKTKSFTTTPAHDAASSPAPPDVARCLMASYAQFLASKRILAQARGLGKLPAIHPRLFDYQKAIVRWALSHGSVAVLADCGLGKTAIQIEYARHIAGNTNYSVLILAPLAVAEQTIEEGKLMDVAIQHCIEQTDVRPGINITNYEKLHHFDPRVFRGIVLDESSIIKSQDGHYRNALIDGFARTPFKLCCTATPAPNDHMELGNHAEFLGIMTRSSMLSTFFVHDAGQTQVWRLKGHAEDAFWRWVSSWAMTLRKPSDIGFSDEGFDLPKLRINHLTVESSQLGVDTLFALPASSLLERRQARRESLTERIDAVAEIANGCKEQFLIWCDLNAESSAIAKLIDGAVEIAGSTPEAKRIDLLLGFISGKYRVLVSKPSIAGHGLNLQNCHNVIFCGLSDSFEMYYQAVRRCWRFGQKSSVNVYIITSYLEQAVVENIKRKEAAATSMAAAMIDHVRESMIEHLYS